VLKLWRKSHQIVSKPNERKLKAAVKVKGKSEIPNKLLNQIVFSALEMTQ